MRLHTVEQEKQNIQAQVAEERAAPPLNSGDQLSRAEFERRYRAHPELKKAELVEGLWLQPAAIWTNDLTTLLKVGQEGLASSEHQAFVEQLQRRLASSVENEG